MFLSWENMGRAKHYTYYERNFIIKLRNNEKTYKEISQIK